MTADAQHTSLAGARPWAWLLASCAGCAAALIATAALSPLVAAPPRAAYVLAFLAVGTAVLLAAWTVPVASPLGATLAIGASLASLVAAALAGDRVAPPLAAALALVALLVLGSVVGAAVGGRTQHPGHLLAVAVLSVLADTLSVLHPLGPTAQVIERPALVPLVVIGWPMIGTRDVAPILGVGDVIFAALYVSASRRHNLGPRRTAVAIGAALLAAMAAVLLLERPVPALSTMAVAVLVAHPAARRLPPRERRRGWLLLACAAVVWAAVLISWWAT